jgi:hypothetical protein
MHVVVLLGLLAGACLCLQWAWWDVLKAAQLEVLDVHAT